jgi:hypothetical protein
MESVVAWEVLTNRLGLYKLLLLQGLLLAEDAGRLLLCVAKDTATQQRWAGLAKHAACSKGWGRLLAKRSGAEHATGLEQRFRGSLPKDALPKARRSCGLAKPQRGPSKDAG